MSANVYFDLTREFNAGGPTAVLASGQAVVYYRVAIMSKDGDWIIQETAEACARVLDVLARHGASYRPGAPSTSDGSRAVGRAISSSPMRRGEESGVISSAAPADLR